MQNLCKTSYAAYRFDLQFDLHPPDLLLCRAKNSRFCPTGTPHQPLTSRMRRTRLGTMRLRNHLLPGSVHALRLRLRFRLRPIHTVTKGAQTMSTTRKTHETRVATIMVVTAACVGLTASALSAGWILGARSETETTAETTTERITDAEVARACVVSATRYAMDDGRVAQPSDVIAFCTSTSEVNGLAAARQMLESADDFVILMQEDGDHA